VFMVSLSAGIMFVVFTCMDFVCGRFYEGGPRVRRPPMKCSVISECLRNTGLPYILEYICWLVH
jgi:hypothetical protein